LCFDAWDIRLPLIRMKDLLTKRASTFVLKAVIVVIGLGVLTMCAFLFPWLWKAGIRNVPEFRYVFFPAMIGVFLTTAPFFFALYQALRLLQNIDADNAFSEMSVQALRLIKYSAVAMSACYAAAMPMAVVFAELDDAPGLIPISAAIVAAPLIVATFAAVLQKLIGSAVDMKAENDLTV
jgi:hypothetical protein